MALSDDDLEARLCALAGSLAVAEAEFLHVLVDLDDRGLWGNLGMRSAAHWLSWRLGMGLTAAREKVRVAHALRQLPVIAAAFGSASLTYCKVRALVRVATPATEAELLDLALGASGAQLERIVRAWRRVLLEESSASATVTRSLRRRDLPDGSVVFTLHVPPEDAAVIDATGTAARTDVGAEAEVQPEEEADTGAPARLGRPAHGPRPPHRRHGRQHRQRHRPTPAHRAAVRDPRHPGPRRRLATGQRGRLGPPSVGSARHDQ